MQLLHQTTRALLSLTLTTVLLVGGALISAAPVSAAQQVINQNFTNDTQGNYAPLNFYDSTYGPGNSTGGIHVPLRVPNPTGTSQPIMLQGISLQMHDHDESLEYILDVYKDGQLIRRVENLRDIKTGGSDSSCGDGGGFVKRWHDHHLPQNAAQDAGCMVAHTNDINLEADTVLLTFHCRTDYCRNNPEVHAHIGNITWWLDVPADNPQPIPAPNLEVLGCVNDAAALYNTDLLRISWTTPQIPIVDVAITDSSATNPWNGAQARYWNKRTPGVTSTTGPAGFIAKTANTGQLLFQADKTYRVVLWDGTRLSEERTVRFEACPTTPKPATASMIGQCSDRQVGEPLSFTLGVNNINLQGNQFRKAVFYLRIPNTSATSAVRNYLGKPNWTESDGSFAYWLGQSLTPPSGNTLSYRWTQGTAIGSFVGNGRTLADLEAWYGSRGETGNHQVAVSIETVADGAVIESKPAASAPVSISPAACVNGGGNPGDPGEPGNPTEPVCIPNCGSAACSTAGAPDGCNGTCPAGTGIGQPNPVQILSPAAGQPIALNQSNQFDLSWRQQPTNNTAASLVTQYAVVIYKQGQYNTSQAAFQAAELGATDAISFTQLAAQGNPAAIYARRVTLSGRLLEGPVVIAIQSRNLQCPAQNGGQQNSAWEEEPHPLNAQLAGRFYLTSNGSCNVAASTPIQLNNATVTATSDSGSTYSGNFGTSGGFTFAVPATSTNYRYNLNFSNGGGPTLRCAPCNDPDTGTPNTCELGLRPGPTDSAHFFVQEYDTSKGPWWQTWGGLIYGHSGISHNPPGYSDQCPEGGETCKPFLSRALGNLAQNSGIAMTNGSFSGLVRDGWWNEFTGTQPHAEGANNKDFVTRENYGFFLERLEGPLPNSFSQSSITELGQIPSPPTDAKAYRDALVSFRDGDLFIDLTADDLETWNVPAGEKRVIFVSGNLTIAQENISQPVITVERGGFLAFVVRGNITFEQSVGYSNSGDGVAIPDVVPMVEGVYIADGTITVASRGSQDRKFVGAGTFVGWSGVSLPRTFENGGIGAATHQSTPTDTFVFRPDFLLSAPDIFKYSDYVWQEIR